LAQLVLQLLGLIERLLLERFSPLDFGFLQLLEFPIVLLAKLVDPVFSFAPVFANLFLVHLFSEVVLPLGDGRLELAYFPHEGLELYIELDLQAVIGDELEPLLNERENADLLVWVESPVFILIEDAHEILNRTDFSKVVKVCLVLLEDHVEYFLSEVGPSHIVFGEGDPYRRALPCAVLVRIGFSLNLGDDSGVQGIEGIEAFGVELNR